MKSLLKLPLLLCLALTAFGQGMKISQYPNTATLNNTNLFIIADPGNVLGGGVTNYNISWLQMKTLITAATVNPTTGYLPYNQGGFFGDTPLYRISTTRLGFTSTNYFLFEDVANGNLALGDSTLNAISSGTFNTMFGVGDGTGLTTGVQNSSFGYHANTSGTGNRNQAFGYAVFGNASFTGDRNVGMGNLVGTALTSGTRNVFIGSQSGQNNTGSDNTALGASSLNGSTSSSENVAIGAGGVLASATGNDNVGLGFQAGLTPSAITNSVFIGKNAGNNNGGSVFVDLVLIGTDNTFNTGAALTRTNAIAIGSQAAPQASNSAQIGTNGVNVLRLNGTVGWHRGSGSPESSVTAPVGSFYTREDGGAGTSIYIKESGTGNTGWIALTSGSSGANPTASVGLSAVNGSASTFMRSDGAPALSQSIAPTWTGVHIFNASSGIPVTIQPGAANTSALVVKGISNTGSDATTGIDLSGTWNSSGSPTLVRAYATNTASGANALLLDLGTGTSSSQFSVRKDGLITVAPSANQNSPVLRQTGQTTGIALQSGTDVMGLVVGGTQVASFNSTAPGLTLASDSRLGFSSSAGGSGWLTTVDTVLSRESAAVFQLGLDAASTTDQVLKAADGSGTDKDGFKFYRKGGQSTGTGRGGALVEMTSLSGSTGSSANSYSTRTWTEAKFVNLTESTATLFANISVASGKHVGGTLIATVNADDGTNFQSLTSNVRFDAVNKAGTVTPAISQTDNTAAVSSGTLTCTYTAVANGNGVDIKANAVSSLTQTTLRIQWMIIGMDSDDVATVAPQ